jgi:uncharacterized protein
MTPLVVAQPLRLDFAALPDRGAWLGPPPEWRVGGGLQVTTGPRTDFWQRTHYGFRRDDGHLFHLLVQGDFAVETRVRWAPRTRYDQCGLMVRAGPECWLKCSVEYEDERHGCLGSVVTNLGFSDWATQDVGPEVQAMSYRVSRRGDDFRVECAADGADWREIRVAHLHGCPAAVAAGAYACSPLGERFECTFEYLEYRACAWTQPS